jgi:hypothetical protein
MGSDAGEKPPGRRRTRVGGVSFWQGEEGARTTELNTRDELAVDADGARWVVTSLIGEEAGPAVESASPLVGGYLLRVIAEKQRVARRRLARPPVPKPARKPAPSLPPHAPVPCPMCRPGAAADHPGEAWPDCECCDGAGVVTAKQAAAWHEEHD